MQPLMLHSGIYQALFVIAVIVFAAQQLPALWSTIQLGGRDSGSTEDRGSFMTVQVGVLTGVVLGYEAAIRLPMATITWHRPLVFFLGIGLMLVGAAMSWIAVRQLGRYFTVVVASRPDQPVIQSGLYRAIRHPSYAGQLLVFAGYAVTLTNWVSILATGIVILAGYIYRIVVEEGVLQARLGAPYADYMTRSHRLIPGIW